MNNLFIKFLRQSGRALLFAILLVLPLNFANAQSPNPPPHFLSVPSQQQTPQNTNCIPHPEDRDKWICLPSDISQPDTLHGNSFLRIYPIPTNGDYKLNVIEPDPFTDYKLKVLPTLPQTPDILLDLPRLLP